MYSKCKHFLLLANDYLTILQSVETMDLEQMESFRRQTHDFAYFPSEFFVSKKEPNFGKYWKYYRSRWHMQNYSETCFKSLSDVKSMCTQTNTILLSYIVRGGLPIFRKTRFHQAKKPESQKALNKCADTSVYMPPWQDMESSELNFHKLS